MSTQAAASVTSAVGQPFASGASTPAHDPQLQEGVSPHRRSVARLGPPLPHRRTSDDNADACSVSEFEWDAGSIAEQALSSRGASSRSRRSSVSVSEHAVPQVCDLRFFSCLCDSQCPCSAVSLMPLLCPRETSSQWSNERQLLQQHHSHHSHQVLCNAHALQVSLLV